MLNAYEYTLSQQCITNTKQSGVNSKVIPLPNDFNQILTTTVGEKFKFEGSKS